MVDDTYKNINTEEILLELQEYKRRLTETEDTLNAIKSGTIDAIVVSGNKGEKIYTLQGTDIIYRLLIEQMKEGTLIIGKDGTIIYSNQIVSNYFLQPLEKIIGRPLLDFIPANQKTIVKNMFEDIKRDFIVENKTNKNMLTMIDQPTQIINPSGIKQEINIEIQDKKIMPVFLSLNAIQLMTEELVFCLIITDLSEQKKNQKIIEEGNLAISILGQITDALFVCDKEGSVILASNLAQEKFCQNIGCLHKNFDHLLTIKIISENDRLFSFKDTLLTSTEAGGNNKYNNVEASVILSDKRHIYILLSTATLLDSNNDVLGSIIRLTDINNLKQAEKDLKESKSQTELYFDLMSHDISNLHQIMLAQLEMAEYIMNTKGKLEGADRILIEDSLNAMTNAIKLIRTVRKIQDFKNREHALENIDLANMLEEALKNYSSIPNLNATINYTPHYGNIVQANPLLKDVFSNLIDNAIKHSNEYEPLKLNIDVSKIYINDTDYYLVSFEDNGTGIPDDIKKTVFQRSKRGPTKSSGSGLGLYIVKSLIDNLGGKIEIEDRIPGNSSMGVRFLVYLPAKN
ncbi:MAG: hypothetical protein HQK51_14025 [Oligoflexia bacterium]|nr:hypothetical protein [Oligoflexia bacterium]